MMPGIQPGETSDEFAERMALEFLRETGLLAPWKLSKEVIKHAEHYNERSKIWQKWVTDKNDNGVFSSPESA
jgi:hypothetical protein